MLIFILTDGEMSDASSVLEKRSQSSSRRSGASSSRSKRPQWQYWGKGGIPSLLDPPSYDPYMPQQVFGPAAIVNTQRECFKLHHLQMLQTGVFKCVFPLSLAGNEWPAAHFAVVNHSMENVVAMNDSTRVYEAMRQVGPPDPLLSKSIGLP